MYFSVLFTTFKGDSAHLHLFLCEIFPRMRVEFGFYPADMERC